MLGWIQKHYIVSFLLLLILVLCALHLNGTRNEDRILPKQGIIIEKDITVDSNRDPNATVTVINASNYSESYVVDVLPIMKAYNCYIFDSLIVNNELYLLARSNDAISDMKLYQLLIFKINDTSLSSNVIGYEFDKFSASLDYIDGKIIASKGNAKYILSPDLSASKIVNTDSISVQNKNVSKHGIQKDKVISDSLIPRDLYMNGKVGDTYLLTVSPLIYAKPNMNLPFEFLKAEQYYGIPIYENMMLFWNTSTDEMEFYNDLKSITSFNIKYMDMDYNIARFEHWNQIIKNNGPEKIR
ncbi:hypothetical protein [Veillonella infantium]|uniref:Lipoprotein n=1 Tax=Veillonella infantium TaxID=1911679 RepID=A0ABX5C5Q8_9FIRM|nr:hypothetical protein [Veillonella infantium]PQL58673.1 hypothetical protein VCHSUH03_00295 [Veillonella infantium]